MPAPYLDRLSAEVIDHTVQPEFTEIAWRVRRRRTRRYALSGAAIMVAVLVGAGVTWGVRPAGHAQQVTTPPSVEPSDRTPFAMGPVVRADAADATHLYAVLKDCASCPFRLVGSDNAGRTWTLRALPSADPDVEVHGPATLTAGIRKLSTDGGHLWTDFDADPTPATRVPPGGWLYCYSAWQMGADAIVSAPAPCEPRVVDPGAGTVRPLAGPLPITPYAVAPAPPAAGLWVLGLDAGRRAAVSVSRDGGATWSTSSFGDPVPAGAVNTKDDGNAYTVQVSTYDGTVAHVITGRPDQHHGYRSTDGGHSWSPTNGGAPLPDPLVDGEPGLTLPDGTHVLQRWPQGGASYVQWLTGVDGAARYDPVPRPGWPVLSSGRYGYPVIGGTGLLLAYDNRTVAWSTDGTTWHQAVPSD
jgi:hypothetical protein